METGTFNQLLMNLTGFVSIIGLGMGIGVIVEEVRQWWRNKHVKGYGKTDRAMDR